MNLKAYPKYKDSGIEWLGKVPEHWNIRKLKFLSSIKLSGVDKKTIEGELPVKLCNYTDVYNNEFISEKLDFMEATATKNEIAQLTINKGDVLITKDSETPDDIAVPAFVTSEFKNVLCGYHLAQVRAKPKYAIGEYLFRLFCAQNIREQFTPLANGITRYGLSKYSIDNSIFPVPPIAEQRTISTFLDHQITRIDELIKKNEQLIELLKEKRQAIISHAVTKGLNPNAKMKDSGIEWIGEISESWTLIPMKYVTYMKGRIGWKGLKQSEFSDEGPYLITGMNFKNGVIRWEEVYHITEERYNEAPEIHLKVGDVLMTKDGTIGKVLFVDVLPDRASLNSHLLVLRPLKDHFLPKYLYYLLHSDYFKDHIEINKTGTTFFGITQEAVGRYKILLPPTKEQENIVSFIDKETAKIDRIIIKIQAQIESLKEYRQALISNVVTGKLRIDEKI